MQHPAFKVAKRGIHVADYLVNGHVTYYSVRGNGEQQALRTVPFGDDPREKIASLWDDLDEHDPPSRRHAPRPSPAASAELSH